MDMLNLAAMEGEICNVCGEASTRFPPSLVAEGEGSLKGCLG